jgi:DNA-binding MarR family transcriptional regulator
MSPTLAEEIHKQSPFDDPAQEAYLNILRTCTALQADFERLFKKNGLSHSTYNALRILRGATAGANAPGKRACNEIGEHLVSRVPDVTRLVDRLETLGLAERVRDSGDRRVVFVRITRKGLALLAKLDEPVSALHRRQMGHMSGSELAELNRLLVVARDRAGIDDPPPAAAPPGDEHEPTA